MASASLDPTSLSNPLEVRVCSSHISLLVDFSRKVLVGHVDHTVKIEKEGSTKLILDTSALKIERVALLVGDKEENIEYRIGGTQGIYGEPLEITVPQPASQGKEFKVRIAYETSPSAGGLQWLEPSQTAGKKHPYVFSTSQCIHGRSVLPCQDSNKGKVTFTASLKVKKPLTALMGATATGSDSAKDSDATTFHFEQKIPVNTYLIAIAVGNVEFREISPNCHVWSEPETVEKGVYEFANVGKFLKAGEDLLVPYPWGRNDILILPPSFAYGGMENPQLIFCSPTLLAGDRSLENVIAHEVAHSWMGNTIGCHIWNEFFLTEGFNVFLERKLLARVYSQDLADFEALNGLQRLTADIASLGPTNPLTCLRVKLDDFDPDDLFSTVPFEKGFNFLYYLQSLVGVPRFEAWLKAYVTKYQHQSLCVEQFKEHFMGHFSGESEVQKIDWDTWIDKPGMPPVINQFSTKFMDAAVALAKRWVEHGGKDASPADIKEFLPGQKLTFLDQLQLLTIEKPFDASILEALDKYLSVNPSKNAELLTRWYVLCIRAGYAPIYPHVTNLLSETGRMRFIRPLYKELHKNPHSKQLAADTLKANYASYHNIAAKIIGKDLQ